MSGEAQKKFCFSKLILFSFPVNTKQSTYFKKLEKLLDSSLKLAASNDNITTGNKEKLQNISSTKQKLSLFAYKESSRNGCHADAVTNKKIKVEETLESSGQENNEKEHENNEEQMKDCESNGPNIKEEMDVDEHEISQENNEEKVAECQSNGQLIKEEMIMEEEHENNEKEMTEYHSSEGKEAETNSTKKQGEKEINTEDAGPSLPPQKKETKGELNFSSIYHITFTSYCVYSPP